MKLDGARQALEHQGRIDDIRAALALWARRGEIRIDTNYPETTTTEECVEFASAPGLKGALDAYFLGVIAELEADIRKLGFEPEGDS